jgi:hypothetical protein
LDAKDILFLTIEQEILPVKLNDNLSQLKAHQLKLTQAQARAKFGGEDMAPEKMEAPKAELKSKARFGGEEKPEEGTAGFKLKLNA